MNFFEHQDKARSTTNKLVVLFLLAVFTLILMTSLLVYGVFFYASSEAGEFSTDIVFSEIFLQVGLGVIVIVVLGSLFRMGQLKGGGRVVAESLGGRLLDPSTRDPDERKVLNVVEEMAIAAGLPVPPVYLMEDQGINAFAAGYHQKDAVIGVTRGCVQQLDRDELQGVIAHEFSHIFNGDMRLNIRLMGILYGIMVLGMIGYFMMRGSMYSHSRRNKGNGILFLGLGLVVIGYGGTFFGNIIKAAVSRQREFLADASAVQFTRNPDGISGALQKIGGYEAGSAITSVDTSEISHMLFEEGQVSGFSSMFATHPPLDERISRIDPNWTAQPKRPKRKSYADEVRREEASGAQSRPGSPTPTWSGMEPAAGFASTGFASAPAMAAAVETVGNPSPEHVQHAESLLELMPQSLKDVAHEPFGARALVQALVIAAGDGSVEAAQLSALEQAWTAEEFKLFSWVLAEAQKLPREQFLPFIDIAIPSLKRLSPKQYRSFMTNLSKTIVADSNISLFEWSLFALIRSNLENQRERGRHFSLQHVMTECGVLLGALAMVGHDSHDGAMAAFNAGVAELGNSKLVYEKGQGLDVRQLDQAMDKLRRLKPLQKPRLLKALVRCVEADGRITLEESELVRTVAALLDCPLPPLLSDH